MGGLTPPPPHLFCWLPGFPILVFCVPGNQQINANMVNENEIFIVIIIITDEGNRQILVFMNALNTHVSNEKQNKTNYDLKLPFTAIKFAVYCKGVLS